MTSRLVWLRKDGHLVRRGHSGRGSRHVVICERFAAWRNAGGADHPSRGSSTGRNSLTAQSEAIWIAIDIGKAAHHAAIDSAGRQLWSIRVHNAHHDIERLLSKARATGDSVLVAAEQTATYMPGRFVNHMTGAFCGEGKTDAKDTVVNAETAA